ncbi:hypothetical protein Efla_007768 [Eimeria flavescens]
MAILRQTSENLKQSAEYTLLTLKDFAQSPLGICHGLLAIYAAGFTMQFVGAPLFGRIGDAWGPRAALPALFLSQLPGVMIHGTQAAMMVVALEIGEQHRTAHLAYLNLSYCVGLVAGGAVGASMAAAVGPRGTLIVAAAIQLCGCFLAFLLDLKSMQAELSRFSSIAYACAPQCVVMTPAESNVLVTLIGATMIGVLAPILATRFVLLPESSRPRQAAAALNLIPVQSSSLPEFAPLADSGVAGDTSYICCTSQVTKLVRREELGSVLGLNASLFFLDAGLSQLIGLPIYAVYGELRVNPLPTPLRVLHYLLLLLLLILLLLTGLRMLWLVCVIVTALLAVYLLLIDAYTFKAFGEEQPVYFPLRSVYE